MIESINPATGERIEAFQPFDQQQVGQAIEQASAAYIEWRRTSFGVRRERFLRLARYLRERKSDLARTATLEMGKTVAEAEAEVEKCAWNCDFYAENSEKYVAVEQIPSTAAESYVAYRPLGVVLAIMPWNFPYWQVFRFAAPALMAGNAAVLKHASNVCRCALNVEQAFREAGFPEGLFRTVLAPGAEVGKIIANPRIAAVTLTGSTQAGASVAAASGGHLKKHVLELGGADAFIVLDDADLDAAAEIGARSRFQNCGQSCIAAKRFIVLDGVFDAFVEKYSAAAEKLLVGDPLDPTTTMGPMARADLREGLDAQVRKSVALGAKAVVGGRPRAGAGCFYEPTILTEVVPGMPAFDEEMFGPVAAVVRARDAADAVRLANASEYGLGGNLWTRDLDKARKMAEDLESGAVFINGMTASEPSLPFGGVKRSGYGRELSSFGIREFVNIQTVWIGPAGPRPPLRPAE